MIYMLISMSNTSSSCCLGGSISDEDEEGDDWEAVADALAATDEKGHCKPCSLDSQVARQNYNGVQSISQTEVGSDVDKSGGLGLRHHVNYRRAWGAGDTLRPPNLPNLAQQYDFPMNLSVSPTSCPICYEDLDFTDTSFIPCLCGFKLCLFCHKRILEEDGRCPGCRKQYDPFTNPLEGEAILQGGSLKFRLPHAPSMMVSKS